MASLSALPALNTGCLEALILISSPVCGLRPIRAERLRTVKEPKPIKVTLSPFLSALVIAWVMPSTARPASALERSAATATASINSALFTLFVPPLLLQPEHPGIRYWVVHARDFIPTAPKPCQATHPDSFILSLHIILLQQEKERGPWVALLIFCHYCRESMWPYMPPLFGFSDPFILNEWCCFRRFLNNWCRHVQQCLL